jgi:hypothetical protein
MTRPSVAVVILNYNGKSLLQQFLPSVIRFSQGTVIYVVDNASTDDSVAFVEKEYQQITLVKLSRNMGFAGGYNEALQQVKADYYVLVNSDVEVTENWIDPVIACMEQDRSIAACQPKLLAYKEKDSFEYAGACGGFIDKYAYPFCRGRIFNSLEKDLGQYNDTREVFWATGACMFVRASVYHELGGFDADYFAHMEEIDLCWRMKNTGHKIYVVPSSVVYHLGGGTLNAISPNKTYLNFRNNLITFTKNHATSAWIWILILRLFLDGVAGIKFLLEGRALHTWAVVRAHWAYYFSLPATLRKRKEVRHRKEFKPSQSGVYNGNIVTSFYLGKIKMFSALPSKKFIA